MLVFAVSRFVQWLIWMEKFRCRSTSQPHTQGSDTLVRTQKNLVGFLGTPTEKTHPKKTHTSTLT